MMRSVIALFLMMFTAALATPTRAQQPSKPNILVVWGDDIGVHNISAYDHGSWRRDTGLAARSRRLSPTAQVYDR